MTRKTPCCCHSPVTPNESPFPTCHSERSASPTCHSERSASPTCHSERKPLSHMSFRTQRSVVRNLVPSPSTGEAFRKSPPPRRGRVTVEVMTAEPASLSPTSRHSSRGGRRFLRCLQVENIAYGARKAGQCLAAVERVARRQCNDVSAAVTCAHQSTAGSSIYSIRVRRRKQRFQPLLPQRNR